MGQYHVDNKAFTAGFTAGATKWNPKLKGVKKVTGLTDRGCILEGTDILVQNGLQDLVTEARGCLRRSASLTSDPVVLAATNRIIRFGGLEPDRVGDDFFLRSDDGSDGSQYTGDILQGACILTPTLYIEKSAPGQLWYTPLHDEFGGLGFANVTLAAGRADATLEECLKVTPDQVEELRDFEHSPCQKLWVSIATNPANMVRADAYAREKFRLPSFRDLIKAPPSSAVMICPHELQDAGVDFFFVIQRVGDLVYGGPMMNHFVFNLGHSIGSAWNMAPLDTFHLPVRLQTGRDLEPYTNWKTCGHRAWLRTHPRSYPERAQCIITSLNFELSQVSRSFTPQAYQRLEGRILGLRNSLDVILSRGLVDPDDAERPEWLALQRQVEILMSKAWGARKAALEPSPVKLAGVDLGGEGELPPPSSAGSPSAPCAGKKKGRARQNVVMKSLVPAVRAAHLLHAVSQSVRRALLRSDPPLLGKRSFAQATSAAINSLVEDGHEIMQHDAVLESVLVADLEGDGGGLDGKVDWSMIIATAARGAEMHTKTGQLEASASLFFKQLMHQIVKREMWRWSQSPLVANLSPDFPEQQAANVYQIVASRFPNLLPQCPTGSPAILAMLRGCAATNGELQAFIGKSALRASHMNGVCRQLVPFFICSYACVLGPIIRWSQGL